MWSGLGWRERPPGHRAARHRYLLGEQRTIKDMIEELHSPEFLYGRATATVLHRESSPASYRLRVCRWPSRRRLLGEASTQKLIFCTLQWATVIGKFFEWSRVIRAQQLWRARKMLLLNKKKATTFWARHPPLATISPSLLDIFDFWIFECWRSQSPGFLASNNYRNCRVSQTWYWSRRWSLSF